MVSEEEMADDNHWEGSQFHVDSPYDDTYLLPEGNR